MIAENLRMDVASNNLANVDTAGFQRQTAHIFPYPEKPIIRVHNGTSQVLGTLGTGAFVEGSHSSFGPGALRTTQNPLDVALVGAGFFAIETPEGTLYTRDGRFTISPGGLLATFDGNIVRGERGPIVVGDGQVLFNEQGEITVNGQFVDKLLMVEFNDRDGLRRRGANLYEALPEAGEPFRYQATVAPGVIEMANVNVVREMVNLITIQRAYEANHKVVQAFDETLGKLNDI